MNPFVNPNKRSISLPTGCKDLIDVLKRSESKSDGTIPASAFRNFINLVLFQAKQDRAMELVIGIALPSGGTPIRYKVENVWHELSPFPSHIRPGVISEILQIAKMAAGQFPNEGILDVTFGNVRVKWTVRITSADAECMLVRIQD
jgi:hypothetical protein